MKSWANREAFHQTVTESMQRTLNDPSFPVPELPENLKLWLAQLTLLYGLPVEYLVPDHRMLPNESIRFFYLDRNWLDRLVDGAISVGVLSTKEMIFNATFFEEIYKQIDEMQLKMRSVVKDKSPTEVIEASGTMTGLLMRSQVVTDFPGVEIEAIDKDEKVLNILRMDRLSNSLILCIFDGVPVRVNFIQPGEGLHFGIFMEVNFVNPKTGKVTQKSTRVDGDPNEFKIYLRGLGSEESRYPAGEQIDVPKGSEQYVSTIGKLLTGASEGVVDITGAVKNIEDTMKGLDPPALEGNLTPGGFAIQMVKSGQLQSYAIKAKDMSTPPPCPITQN